MNNKALKIIILVFILLSGMQVFAQQWSGSKKPKFWDLWSINVNMGLTSFFGDLSVYDTDIPNKISYESGPGLGIVGHKYLQKKFYVGGQILYGSFKGQDLKKVFESTFIEYNLQAGVNLLGLINPSNPKFNFYKFKKFKMAINGYAGIGQFIFDTKPKYKNPLPNEIVNRVKTGTPEFVYFFGFNGMYRVKDYFFVTADFGLRQAQNDKLDGFKENDDFDYYSYFSIGATYYIKNLMGKDFNRSRKSLSRFPMMKRR